MTRSSRRRPCPSVKGPRAKARQPQSSPAGITVDPSGSRASMAFVTVLLLLLSAVIGQADSSGSVRRHSSRRFAWGCCICRYISGIPPAHGPTIVTLHSPHPRCSYWCSCIPGCDSSRQYQVHPTQNTSANSESGTPVVGTASVSSYSAPARSRTQPCQSHRSGRPSTSGRDRTRWRCPGSPRTPRRTWHLCPAKPRLCCPSQH